MISQETVANGPVEFVIAGHSHIFCLGAPWDYRGPVALERARWPSPEHGHVVCERWMPDRSEAYWAHLIQQSRGRRIILSYAGNQHIGNFLFAPEPMIDFFDPAHPDDLPLAGATVVPRALMKDHFGESVAPLRWIVERVMAKGAIAVTLIGTPPPRADVEKYRDYVAGSEAFRRLAKARGADIGTFRLTPSVILRKLWGIHQEIVQEIAAATGARFVPVPPEVCDERGFLLDAYGDDFTHGNHLFGRKMLELALGEAGP